MYLCMYKIYSVYHETILEQTMRKLKYCKSVGIVMNTCKNGCVTKGCVYVATCKNLIPVKMALCCSGLAIKALTQACRSGT